jgi:RHS repeat-associated protein
VAGFRSHFQLGNQAIPTTGGKWGTSRLSPELSPELVESDLSGNPVEQYIFFNGQRISRRDVSSSGSTIAVHYYFSDHLGSSTVVENATATSCEQDIDYYPYGGVENDYCPNVPQNYKFTGKERDSESDLDNFEARYLGSSLGRFMSPDPMGGHKEDPQTLNKYAYVRNNPLNLTDPTGLDFNLTCSGKDTATCHGGVQGTTTTITDANGNQTSKFAATQIGDDGKGGLVDKTTNTGAYTPVSDRTASVSLRMEGRRRPRVCSRTGLIRLTFKVRAT